MPPDPRYKLALRALAMSPLCHILNTLLVLYLVYISIGRLSAIVADL